MARTNAQRQRDYRERKKKKERNEKVLQLRQFANKIISRPALRYHGSKWRMANWIIEHFPPHDCYVEPFGGAASVLLRKAPATHEIYNDLNSDVVNFFHCLREYPDELIRLINLTPWSREEWHEAWNYHPEPLERARRFYVRCWQSYGSGTGQSPESAGWRNQKKSDKKERYAINDQHDTRRLWDVAARLLAVQIENDDAFAVINRYDTPDTLFYIDPPYVYSTRSDKWAGNAYEYELSDGEHRRLADVLKAVQGMVVLSGYQSDLYTELYPNWDVVEKAARSVNNAKTTEYLWLSPGVYDAVKMPLFNQTR